MATAGTLNQEGRIDLQLFAEGETQEQETQEQETQEQEQAEEETVALTKAEFEAEKQREADRRVNQAKKKWEAEFKQTLEQEKAAARKEAEELAKLSESERLKVEKEKEEMRLEKERQEFAQEKAEFERERLQLQTEKELASRKLPTEFAPYILGADADDTFERMTTFEEKWQKAIEAEIQERLKSKTPKFGATKKAHFTRAQVEAMSQDEVTANLPEIEESMKLW